MATTNSQSVWVKKEGKEDDDALEFDVPVGMNVGALLRALYADPIFAFVPGSIKCLLGRAEDGSKKVWVALAFCLTRRNFATVIQ